MPAYRTKLSALLELGGEGSGNFGHAGRPGEVGGSGEGGGETREAKTQAISERILKESGGKLAVLDLRPKANGDVELETLAVAPGEGGGGVGTKAMESLTDWADDEGVRLILSPSQKGYQPVEKGPKTTSPARLKRFYKRFGFVEPKGRHYDPTLSSPTRPTMFRAPQKKKPITNLGGPGSGNFGHGGRPGEVGGSSGGGDASVAAGLKDSTNYHQGVYYSTKSGIAEIQQQLETPTTVQKGTRGFYLEDADGNKFGPDGFGEKQTATTATQHFETAGKDYPKVALHERDVRNTLLPRDEVYKGDTVDGLRVRTHIPNTDSISATFSDHEYEELPGIRAVKVKDLHPTPYASADDNRRVDALAAQIKESGEIAPLIVVRDSEGTYPLEGNHRLRALAKLGKTEVPALVIVHYDDKVKADLSYKLGGPGSGNFGHGGRPGEVGGSASEGEGGGEAKGDGGGDGGGEADGEEWPYIDFENTTHGERAIAPQKNAEGYFDDPPKGYIRMYRGVNPERNQVAAEDETHGEWFTTTYEDAVSYANWDYEGSGELAPGAAVVIVDAPVEDAFEYARSGSRRQIRDQDELLDPDHAVEMRVDSEVAAKAVVYEGDEAEAKRGMVVKGYYRNKLAFLLGGAGSGNFGHGGRPGERGGSSSDGGMAKRLPDTPDVYFKRDDSTRMLPVSEVVLPTINDPSLYNAAKSRAIGHMDDAASGKVQRREPLTVIPTGDGKFEVVDGLATVALVKSAGWKQIPVHIEHAAVQSGVEKVTVGGREVAIVKSENSIKKGDLLVPVDVHAFDKAWQKDAGFHIDPSGKGKIGTRLEGVQKHLQTGTELDAAEVVVDADGRVGVKDGRHRMAVLRDAGVGKVPVAMTKESLANAKKHGLIAKPYAVRHLTYRERLALLLGGPGSGNFGHEGRPGEVGGSGGDSGGDSKGKGGAAAVAEPEEDYRGMHRAPSRGGGAPLNDLTGAGTIYPDDIYSSKAAQYYGTGDSKRDRETIAIIKRMKDRPDVSVPVYRAVPKDAPDEINPGDWVTINKNYAIDHGEGPLQGDYKVVAIAAKASDLFTNGDSIHEWGWDPEKKLSYRYSFATFLLGGAGSGNFGHGGRPGEVGGSGEGGGASGVGAPYFNRNPRLAPFRSIPVVRSEGTGSRHPEAEVAGGKIHLYPKFDKLAPAVQDFVFAHEVGHAVLDEKGLTALVPDAEALGIDVWDTDNLPFGQNNMHEAFADAFASYHTDREVVTRYPAWAKLVETYAKRKKGKQDLSFRSRLFLYQLGGAGSGNFGHSGRPGEIGGSGEGDEGGGFGDIPQRFHDARSFDKNEGYDWHERPEMEEYAKNLPADEVQAVDDYAGFSYGDVNRLLRGSYEPDIIDEYVREATAEEAAQYKPQYTSSKAKDYDPDDPTNKVEDGRIIKSGWHPVTGERLPGNEVSYSIQRAVPDKARVAEIEAKAEKINTLIRERGYELEEPIKVNRAAYIPGMSYADLKAMEGSTMEEKGFSSTMIGNPSGRLDSYVVGAKAESIAKRHDSGKIYEHQDEVAAPMRVEILLPAGTKVAPVETLRRIDHEYPKIPDPSVKDHPEWLKNDDGTPNGLKPSDFTIRDRTAKPTVKTNRLHETSQRSEAEILLGSGAQFRIVSVRRGDKRIVSSDPQMKPIDVIDVKLEYIGGGSSDPNAKMTPTKLADFQWHWLELGGPGSGNFGHGGRPGEVGGSTSEGGGDGKAESKGKVSEGPASTGGSEGGPKPHEVFDESSPIDMKRKAFMEIIKEGERHETEVDALRTEMNDAWQRWAADTKDRKKPLKPDGAAAKKLPSYQEAKALEEQFHAKYEESRAAHKEMDKKAREALRVPAEDMSSVVFEDSKSNPLHPGVASSAKVALVMFRRFDGSGAFIPTKYPADTVEKFKEAFGGQDLLKPNADGTVSIPATIRLEKAEGGRAHATLGAVHIAGGRDLEGTVWHEVAHHIEMKSPAVLRAAVEFRDSLANQPHEVYKLNTVRPSLGDDEVALKGKFPDPYVGKLYRHGGQDIATEIVSTGVHSYIADPVAFARDRPEHFKFIFDVMHGKYREAS